MEEFPPIGSQRQFPFQISVYAFLLDHCIQTGPVLPAVQTMQILAGLMHELLSDFHSKIMVNATFGKLLPLPIDQKQINALCVVESLKNRHLLVKLLTKFKSKSGIVRSLQHASLEFIPGDNYSLPLVGRPEEKQNIIIPVSKIYPGLVSFGESFQNLLKPIKLSQNSAKVQVSGGNTVPGPFNLGSPFPLDAAFQAACAWGRHYTKRICYPVAFEKRTIFEPTKTNEKYDAFISLKSQNGGTLEFDLSLIDSSGNVNELIEGLKMKEIEVGLIKHPA